MFTLDVYFAAYNMNIIIRNIICFYVDIILDWLDIGVGTYFCVDIRRVKNYQLTSYNYNYLRQTKSYDLHYYWVYLQ